jgi:hypothetical protein
MIRAILGFSDFVFGAGADDDGAEPGSVHPPEHPLAKPSKTVIRPQAIQGELK